MIFLSYSSKDLETVENILAEIRISIKEEIWFGKENIGPGDEWNNLVKSAISKSRVILYFLSQNSDFNNSSGFLNEEKKMILKEYETNPYKLFIAVQIDDFGKTLEHYQFFKKIRLVPKHTLGEPELRESKGFKSLIHNLNISPKFRKRNKNDDRTS